VCHNRRKNYETIEHLKDSAFKRLTGIQPKQLTIQVNTMDTAATAAFALGLLLPPEWDGVPVYEAFGLPMERQSAGCK
jgi:hypothetical protein